MAAYVRQTRNGRRHTRQIERQRADTAELIAVLEDPGDLADVGRNLGELQAELAERWEAVVQPGSVVPERADEWLTIEQVARLTGWGVSTIKHAAKDAIPGRRQLRPNGTVRWSKRAILRWLTHATLQSR